MNENEIEIINDELEEVKEIKKIPKKRKLKKKLLIQTLFCSISILFIIGCFIFYGLRLHKYYKIYNPVTENGKTISLLSNYINENSNIVYEKDGLYKLKGTLIYKGKEVDNYIKYSNLTWRIIKVNRDNTMDIVLDDSINMLRWSNKIVDYKDSDINKYLNDDFIKYLNKNLLTKTTICENTIENVSEISCTKTNVDFFVRLLDINEFLNSKVEDSYISNGLNIWLNNRGNESAWNINNLNVSYSPVNEGYYVKPVVTLKSSTPLIKGSGKKDDPYLIEEIKNEVSIGKYVKLGEDIWTIYNMTNEKLNLQLSTLYSNGTKTYRFDIEKNKYDTGKEYSLAKYLNNDYYNELSYKGQLLEETWYTGEYNKSYKDIYSESVKAKVGTLNITDLKFDNLKGYYLINGAKESSIVYSEILLESKPTFTRSIRPAITIKNTKIKSGSGTLEDPFILEA